MQNIRERRIKNEYRGVFWLRKTDGEMLDGTGWKG
jgi:hypothetical protein